MCFYRIWFVGAFHTQWTLINVSIEVASTNLSTNMIWIAARKKLATDNRLIEKSDSPSLIMTLNIYVYMCFVFSKLSQDLIYLFFIIFLPSTPFYYLFHKRRGGSDCSRARSELPSFWGWTETRFPMPCAIFSSNAWQISVIALLKGILLRFRWILADVQYKKFVVDFVTVIRAPSPTWAQEPNWRSVDCCVYVLFTRVFRPKLPKPLKQKSSLGELYSHGTW